MDAADGTKCWDILSQKVGEPDRRGWGEQFIEYTRILRKGTPVEQAECLHRLYRVKAPLPDTHQMMVKRFEDQLLPDLAKALKKTVGPMRSILHRDQPAFAGEAPHRPNEKVPPKPASLKGWEEGTGFHVYGSGLVFGESPVSGRDDQPLTDGACITLFRRALNGPWLVLHRTQTQANRPDMVEARDGVSGQIVDNRETYEGTLWVAVHADHAEAVDELVAQSKDLGSVFVEGGTSAAVDAEVRDDPWYRRDFEAGEAKGRGFIIELGGDGLCTWKGAMQGDQLCLVAADGMWE